MDGTVLTAGEVAKRLRIAESTLRAWHRRYGLGPDAPEPGGHRRYGSDDLARLRRMRDLIATGVPPSSAAASVRDTVPDLAATVAAVVAAARGLDALDCADHLGRAVAAWGVVDTWERVCRPALVAVDDDQRDDPDCVACEHALSWAVSAALHRVPRPVGAPATTLLACGDDEQHVLPLEALAAALAERDVAVRMLGAAVPKQALIRAVASTGVTAALLWAQAPATARAESVRALVRRGVRTLVAGPGWRRTRAGPSASPASGPP
ncbi:MerR family transcriptional regulator [Actinokineospora soli]|uniref:MerR family transcriptional regulator n=1 Tax=Actinokineospora soli TaxID=1048753 RepID=A0ABW2TV42_9PSEU